MTRKLELVAALAGLALAGACTDPDQAPAEAAMKAAESEVSRLGGDVARLAPAQARDVEDALAAGRGLMASRDYKGALAGARAIPSKVKEAQSAAEARKEELAKAWTEASRDVQNLLYAIEDRLDVLSGSRKLPRGLDPSAIAWARESLAVIEARWAKGPEQLRTGEMTEAIARAQELEAQAREILEKIGMP